MNAYAFPNQETRPNWFDTLKFFNKIGSFLKETVQLALGRLELWGVWGVWEG